MGYQFTPEELASFKKDGYIIVPASKHQLVDPALLHKWAYEIKAWPKEPGVPYMAYDELNADGQRQMMKMEYFTDFHKGMSEFLRHSGLTDLLKQLTGNEMCLFKDKINYKAPKGHGFLPHIDSPSYDQAGPKYHLTALVAVDPNTRQNGCLEVVAGSDEMELEYDPEWVAKQAPIPTGILSSKWEAAHEWSAAEMAPGDVLFFSSHLAHRSSVNNSNMSRASVYATYCSTDNGGDQAYEEYYRLRRDIYPPEYARDPKKDYTAGFNYFAPAGWDLGGANLPKALQQEARG